jgi:hypothetical protein
MSTKGESFSSARHGEALFTAKRPEMQPLINHLREVAQVATTFVLIDGFGLVGRSVGAGRQCRTAIKRSAKAVICEFTPCGRLARALQPASPIPARG